MTWPVYEVSSWSRFTDLAAGITFPQPHVKPYVVRGQADESWPLKPSLLRLFPQGVTAEDALVVEEVGFDEFRSQAHLHLPSEVLPRAYPNPPLGEWWALMQHYYAPTRLLDWTLSPYVAAYYAIEQQFDKAGAIFVVHRPTASRPFNEHFPSGKVTNEQFRDPKAPAALLFWSPVKKTDRFVAQQGFFSLSINVLGVHDDLITATCKEARQKEPKTLFYEKWVIPPHLKIEFLRKLRYMNIAAHSLFPGIDGLGRSLAEVARLETA